VEVIGGIFNVRLGSDKPLYPQKLAFDKTYYLGIAVEQDGEMTPRQEMTSVAYSLGPWQESDGNVHYGSGDVGIGTTSPELSLHVVGPNGGTAVETMKIDSDGEADDVPFRIRSDPTGSESVTDADTKFIVMGDGKVGIGTATPTATLDVTGDVYVSGEISWPEKTSYCAFAPCAFVSSNESSDYSTYQYGLSTNESWGAFYAPVQLPDGVTVDRISCWWTDDSDDNGSLSLVRNSRDSGTFANMAMLVSRWNSTTRHFSPSETISHAVIDNQNYNYYFHLVLYRDMIFHNARIRFTYTTIH